MILENTFPKHGATVLKMTFAKLINVEATSRQENVPPQIFILNVFIWMGVKHKENKCLAILPCNYKI